MELIFIKSKEQLNDLVGKQKYSQFLQSWQWGQFQEKVAGKIFRLGIQEKGQLTTVATIIKKLLPIGKSYFYCPRGPIVRNLKLEISNLLFDEIRKLAKKEKVIFFRFEPEFSITNSQFLISKTIDVQPSKTLILDLFKSEEELLKDMRQKTRYNIRLAERKGIKIIEANINQFENFWQIMNETSHRDNFRLHSQNYYQEMLKIEKDFIKLFLAEYEHKIIAVSIISFFGNAVTYLHGASSNKYRNIMAPYLLQWHCMKLAKEQGYNYYDLGGVDENKWPGLTKFKKGFGGREFEYPGTFDLVFNKRWYGIYKLIRRLRRGS